MAPKKKKRKKNRQNLPEDSGHRMAARVIGIETGIQQFDRVRVVYVDSKKFRLMTMPDYTPAIGKVEGRVRILTDEGLHTIENITGFYMLKNNLFELLLTEEEKA